MNISASAVMAATGTITALLSMLLFLINYRKYHGAISSKAASEFPLSELFPIGFSVIKILKINVRSESFSIKRERIAELYGEKNKDYYTFLIAGAQITYSLLLLPVSLLIGALTGSTETGLLGIAASVLVLFCIDADIKKKTEERHDEILCELPDMINRLMLLIQAGMVLREAWNLTADSSDSILCREMRKTGDDIKNGMAEEEAFAKFADRCHLREIRKFVSMLIQNLKKGSTGLAEVLQTEALSQWEEKKNIVKRKSAASEQKLLIPMIMIFAAIIMMVIIPIFTNIF